MVKIGIRVFPDNVEEVSKLNVDYFEAAVRPATDLKVYDSIKDRIAGIHGAILTQEVNFMNRLYRSVYNPPAISKAMKAADEIPECKYVVFHPGYIAERAEECSLDNLEKLMRRYDDERFHLEVVPVFAYQERYVFPVHSVEDYKRLKKETGKKMLLDIGHAMITARAMNYDPVDYISRLIEELDIRIVHVADNDERGDGYEDSHLHIGEGNVPIEKILRKYKDIIEFATLEVNGVNAKDIELVTDWLQKSIKFK
ncbi:sugar phosphate isomerase/epimerase [Candidatus Woesearchaeota archaeon]|nr:sugar phosphate isomerase/epimerase [Candidatus Woesearchaeota archaeon]